MKAYTSNLGLHTQLLIYLLICPHNALESHLKLFIFSEKKIFRKPLNFLKEISLMARYRFDPERMELNLLSMVWSNNPTFWLGYLVMHLCMPIGFKSKPIKQSYSFKCKVREPVRGLDPWPIRQYTLLKRKLRMSRKERICKDIFIHFFYGYP